MTRIRAVLCAGGALMMAYAVIGLLTDPDVEPGGMLVFLAAAQTAHDVVWLPAVIALGAVLTRFVSRRHRPAAQIAALVAAVLAVVALPPVLGVGRAADNPSIQPLDYGKNVTLLLLALAGGALAAVLYRRVAVRDRDRPA